MRPRRLPTYSLHFIIQQPFYSTEDDDKDSTRKSHIYDPVAFMLVAGCTAVI